MCTPNPSRHHYLDVSQTYQNSPQTPPVFLISPGHHGLPMARARHLGAILDSDQPFIPHQFYFLNLSQTTFPWSAHCHYTFLGYHYLLFGILQRPLSWLPNYLLCLSLIDLPTCSQMILPKGNLTSHSTALSMILKTCSEFPKDNVKIL